MNKYVLSALVVPVALMGAVTAQAKTTLLKATVNQAKSGTKVVSGKATRGAKIKISRAGVTYGVAKTNKHGHFVMKLKRAVKGGWTYKVTVTKAGFKVKSGYFKVKRGKKQVNVVKPSKATPTTLVPVSRPSSAPTTPSAPTAPKSNVNTCISSTDIEANQINAEISGLNRQLDAASFGQQRLDTTQRAFFGNQIDQLQNRVNVFAARPNVNSTTVMIMNNNLVLLRQKLNGLLSTFVSSRSNVTAKSAIDHSQNVVKNDEPIWQQVSKLKMQNQALIEETDELNKQIADTNNKIDEDTENAEATEYYDPDNLDEIISYEDQIKGYEKDLSTFKQKSHKIDAQIQFNKDKIQSLQETQK
ncbi:Ig-like domain-containing protein [Lentilactobacillus hilgardii]|uniref:Ig-like domain-containing protein n=1 Tax=Lentilactobacillus hilgardii TaxID=1588 RepID=UPI0021C292BF|nr:Ig-like domain-containing protein [Lentilactobacillus hilgardii]MCP9333621.1 hypothetical protein [Lentilactobacillus hilgardii]MCP9350188.1 hypothetical protein [Lentilactobacillus hilgardii]MCP9353064.1 hypothetical protein [Lentilactobacillus hilgardii]